MATSNGIDKVRHDAVRNSSGTGYVILNRSMNREDYIKSCHRNGTITMITESGEVLRNIFVDKSSWQYIEFPELNNQRGSCLIWININSKNKPIVIAVINKKDQLNEIQTVNSFKFVRNNFVTSALIEGLGDSGEINVVTNGSSEGESKINIRILNDNTAGLLDILVQGDINITSEDKATIKLKNGIFIGIKNELDTESIQTEISYELGVGLVISDEFGNKLKTSEDGIEIEVKKGNKIISKGGEKIEPALLGDSTEEALNALLDALQEITSCLQNTATANAVGPTAPVGIALSPGVASSLLKIKIAQAKIKLIKSKTVQLS